MIRFSLILSITCFFFLLSPLPARAVQPVSFWENKLNSVWDSDHTKYFLPWSQRTDSYYQYFIGYGIEGNTSAYQATGNTKYIDRPLLYIKNVMATAKVSSSISTSQYKDSYFGWPNYDDGNVEAVLRESMMWRTVARLLRVMHDSPTIMTNSTYKSQYTQILTFMEKNIWQKWYSRGITTILRSLTHMSAHMPLMCLNLVQVTSNQTIIDQCNNVNYKYNHDMSPYWPYNGKYSSLKQQLVNNPKDSSAYFWNWEWGNFSTPGSDTMHGGHVVSYIVEASEHGQYWSTTEVNKLANTAYKILWNQSTTSPHFSEFVDGTNGNSGINYGDFQSEWIKLGRYNSKLQEVYEKFAGTSAPGLYQTQLYGNGALNAKILLSGSSTPTPTPKPSTTPTPTLPPSGTNLLPNSSFETTLGTDYFTHGTASFYQVTDAARTGTHSLKIVSTDSSTSVFSRWLSTNSILTVTPGTTYTTSVFARKTGSGYAQLVINFWGPGPYDLISNHESSSLTQDNTWSQLTRTVTAPTSAKYARVEMRLYGAGSAWFDDISFSSDSGGGGPTSTCPGDINADNQVNLTDFLLLMADFLKPVSSSPADLNQDGSVNLTDFLLLKENFLKPCS